MSIEEKLKTEIAGIIVAYSATIHAAIVGGKQNKKYQFYLNNTLLIVKKTNQIILLFWITLTNLMAQEYQSVLSDRIGYFGNQNGNIKCIRIDSAIFQKDSVLYPFLNIQQLDDNCYTPFGASWIGNKIIIKNNGYNFFFNRDQDTIKIKTSALINESWIAYELRDSIRIIAEVINHDSLSVLGQLDSVKTIGFKVYDETMHLISHRLNSMTIILSKNYGFVKTFNFNLFLDYRMDLFDEHLEEYKLIGLSNPKLGIQNLTKLEVYDFQPGDELHILYDYSYTWDDGTYKAKTTKTIYKYLERIDYLDSILYNVNIEQSTKSTYNDSITYKYLNDTIESMITPDSVFDKLPGDPIIIYNYSAYTNEMEIGITLSKISPSWVRSIYFEGTSCWNTSQNDMCSSEEEYIKGLGGPYFECSSMLMGPKSISNQLVYYKKGQEVWGAPLLISSTLKNEEKVKAIIYPNPAKDNLWINTSISSLPFLFELINLNGQTIINKEISSDLSSIDLGGCFNGIYIYRLRNREGIIKYGKLIIE